MLNRDCGCQLFLGIVLLKQTKWDAIVPAIAPLTVHGWAAFIHVSTPTAQRTFNTNTGVAEAFLNFILVGSLGGKTFKLSMTLSQASLLV
jgi:hypothetical protein